jgi:hypothetical protein
MDVAPQEPGANMPPTLRARNSLPTRFLSEVVARLDVHSITKELEHIHPSTSSTSYWTCTRVELMRSIAHAVQQRSSALIAAACIGLLNCVQDIHIDAEKENRITNNGVYSSGSDMEELVIAYAGGTISQYPQWLETCQHWIDTLVRAGSRRNGNKKVVLREALDGGIVGAGVLAGMVGEIA